MYSFSDEDHPRVCGNYGNSNRKKVFFLGSPPRVRELLILPVDMPVFNRITPACAGITNT